MSWRQQKISALKGAPDYGYTTQVGNGGILTMPQIGNAQDGLAGGYQPKPNLPKNPQDLFTPHAGPMYYSVWDEPETAILYAPDFVKSSFHGLNRIGKACAGYQPPCGEQLVGSTVHALPVSIPLFPEPGLPRLRAVVQPNQRWHQ